MLLFHQPYFLLTQLLVCIAFWLWRKKEPIHHHNGFLFPSPLHFTLLLSAAIINGICFNLTYQLYCIPVTWAIVVLSIYGIYLILHPFLNTSNNSLISPIILGMGLFINTYLILFGGINYLLYLLFHLLPFALIAYLIPHVNKKWNTNVWTAFYLLFLSIALPYFLIAWTIKQFWRKSRPQQLALTFVPIIFCCIGLFLSDRMDAIITKIEQSENLDSTLQTTIQHPIDRYLTELILGAHWKYHTQLCNYDGWRPPFHDPVLGFAKPILYPQQAFHKQMDLPERKQWYQTLFPKQPTAFSCSCAAKERLGE